MDGDEKKPTDGDDPHVHVHVGGDGAPTGDGTRLKESRESVAVVRDEDKDGAVSVLQLYRFSTTFDVFVLVIGAVAAAAAGGVNAAFAILLGRVNNGASCAPPPPGRLH